jgi:GR25 family glycosyltransferase involved in LPS biosynthesis
LSESIIFENKKFEIKKNIWTCHLANFLSHYEIWNLEEDTLVIEDDVIFDNELFEKIPNIIDSFLKLDEDNKILYLQISTPWLEDGKEKNFNLIKVNENIGKYVSGDVSGTAAYYITKECKKVLLQNMRPILPCDQYLDNLLKTGVINYYLPIDKSMMFKLDTKTMLL